MSDAFRVIAEECCSEHIADLTAFNDILDELGRRLHKCQKLVSK
jgi:hypothetical protein